jgi:hypothetical protein
VTVRRACPDAAMVYAAELGLIALVAVGLLLFASSAEARALMPLGFGRLDPTPRTAASIAAHNARVALVPIALAPLAGGRGVVRRGADLVLSGLLALNAAELGAALAGYGARTVAALAPHVPLELAGYAVAGAAYLAGRRRALSPGGLLAFAACCGLLLAAAAVLETYVQLRISR